jgi:hypothetical protein
MTTVHWSWVGLLMPLIEHVKRQSDWQDKQVCRLVFHVKPRLQVNPLET